MSKEELEKRRQTLRDIKSLDPMSFMLISNSVQVLKAREDLERGEADAKNQNA